VANVSTSPPDTKVVGESRQVPLSFPSGYPFALGSHRGSRAREAAADNARSQCKNAAVTLVPGPAEMPEDKAKSRGLPRITVLSQSLW